MISSSSPETKAGSRWSLWSHQSSNNRPPTDLTEVTVSAASRAGTSEDNSGQSIQSGAQTGSPSDILSVATDIRIPIHDADGTELDVYHLTENGLEKQRQMSREEIEQLMEGGV
jgi:hypothetical protein